MPISKTVTTNLVASLCQFHKDVGSIEKTARAQYGEYADLAVVLDTITPALAKNGLVLLQSFRDDGETRYLVTSLMHTSGESLESASRLVEPEAQARHNILHLWGGSVTYQRRYCALAMLGLAAGMEDDDGQIANAAPAKPPAKKPAKRKVAAKPFDSVEFAVVEIEAATTLEQLDKIVERIQASGFIGPDLVRAREAHFASKEAIINPQA